MSKLKQFLDAKGWSQHTFAALIGVPQALVSLWVNGLRIPCLKNAHRIESATEGGIPTTYWIGHEMRRRPKTGRGRDRMPPSKDV